MNDLTTERVREFLLAKYAPQIKGVGMDPAALPDDFDFLLNGVVDSFGILEMVSAIEDEFGLSLDLAALDAEQMTILGPLSEFVAQNAQPK
jgi:acyl carrier protein